MLDLSISKAWSFSESKWDLSLKETEVKFSEFVDLFMK